MIDATIPDGSVLAEHPTRMTKRVKTYKPKQGLTKAQVQTLVAMMKAELEALEWSIVQYSFSAKELKSTNKDRAELYFKRADKVRKQRNKLSRIQHTLKRGLV